MPEEKAKYKAKETLEIYGGIAHRLGISKIKWELEDLALRYIDPDGYYDLVDKVSMKRSPNLNSQKKRWHKFLQIFHMIFAPLLPC